MGDAMAVLVRRAIEGFGRRDFHTGFQVENLLSGQRGIKSIGAMDANAGLRRVPVAFGTSFELDFGREGASNSKL